MAMSNIHLDAVDIQWHVLQSGTSQSFGVAVESNSQYHLHFQLILPFFIQGISIWEKK
jgi:hypothetical protein